MVVMAAYHTQHAGVTARFQDDGKQVSTAGSISKSAAMRMSIEEGRPSIMSESLAGSALMATRIPYRNNQGQHNLMATT